jgi:hypothetical protein
MNRSAEIKRRRRPERTGPRRPGLVSPSRLGLALCALAVGLCAPPASAQTIHPQVASFGKDGTAESSFGSGLRQIALQQEGEKLYALRTTPTAERGIYGFDLSVPSTYTPLGGNFPIPVDASGTEPDLVTDNTALASAGNIYYSSQSTAKIYGFDSAGAALGGGFPISPPAPTSPRGAGVDTGGDLWVGDFTARAVRRYDVATATQIGAVDAFGQASGTPGRIAFDSSGDMYVAFINNAVVKYTASSAYNPQFATVIDAESTRAVTVDRSTDTVYVLHNNRAQAYEPDGTEIAEFATGISTGLRGIAIDEATKDIFVSDSNGGGHIHAFETVVAPDLATGAASGITRTEATISGEVAPDPEGGGEVTECFFEYGLSDSYGSIAPCDPGPGYPVAAEVSADLGGLELDTTYHYRLVAGNATANSTNYGDDRTFETAPAVADLTVEPVSDVTQSSTTLNGSFTGNGEPTAFYFEWGPTTAYGNRTAEPPGEAVGSPVGPTPLSAELGGLDIYLPTSGTYHYRLVATNEAGTTVGADHIFHTAPPFLPGIGGTSATSVTPTGATLGAEVNPGNGQTVYLFEYGTSASYGSATPIGEAIEAGEETHPIAADVSGLTPATTYHYRAVALNFGGTSYGPDRTFTTPNVPAIESSQVSQVGETSAHLSALVAGNASPTKVHFEYGTSDAYGLRTPALAAGEGLIGAPVGIDLGHLAPGTTYHARAVASNGIGTTYGPNQTFTTESARPQASESARCGRLARGAKRQANRARLLRRRAGRTTDRTRKRALRRRARNQAKRARRTSGRAKACKREGSAG